jgi:phage-related protein
MAYFFINLQLFAADGTLNFDTKLDSSGFSNGVSKMGGIIETGLGVLTGNLMTSAVSKIGEIGTAAIDAGANLEQSIGGIETLFGTGGKSVEEYASSVGKSVADAQKDYDQLMQAQTNALDNANKAWQTAGLSANDYMQNVTSFAAALKGSTENETEAADAADKAVIAMADNVNKMGSSMESVQNAYLGFAKGNYTMLDNLKLGYGGTKGEMQRLLKDAEKLHTEATGEATHYDINNLADVYSAIQDVQNELGITGTTAKEGAATWSGSMAEVSAAWENVLGAITSGQGDLGEAVTGMGTALGDALGNVLRFGENILTAMPEAISTFVSTVVPQLLETGHELVTNLVAGIQTNVPQMLQAAGTTIQGFLSGVQKELPQLLANGVQIINNLVTGILNGLPKLLAQGGSLITSLLQTIGTAIPQLLNSGAEIITNLANGLSQNLPTLLETAGNNMASFLDTILTYLPQILESGMKLLTALAQGIIKNLPAIISAAAKILAKLIAVILDHLPEILTTGIKLLAELVVGIIKAIPKIIEAVPKIFKAFTNAFKGYDWKSIGINILKGVANGIKESVGDIVSAAKKAAKDALNAAKKALGIHSPSKVFKDEVGRYMALGMAEGFEDTAKGLKFDDMAGSLVHRAASVVGMSSAAPTASGGKTAETTIEVPLYINGREFARATAHDISRQLAWEN